MTTSEEQQKAIKSRSFKATNEKIPSPTKKTPSPHLIHYAVTKDLGTILAYARHPTRDTQGFSGKAYSAIDNDEQLLDMLKITFLSHRRSEHDPVEFKDADPPGGLMVPLLGLRLSKTSFHGSLWFIWLRILNIAPLQMPKHD